jgi:crotonobetainyl-CoA:carnitine CoA-transferase CaiB-like acyl-CoA transferase
MKTDNRGALRGVRVLDVTCAVAGPYCAQVLADHGADVIKVEPIEGDFFRKVGPFRADDRVRAYGGVFQAVNRNKRSIALNLKSPQGREVFLALVRSADVLVENFRAGVLDKMGLGYEALRTVRPSLVYTSVRGFGDRAGGASPYMDWPAFDIVAQAMGGWMGITGNDPEHPMKVGGGLGDTVPDLFAAFGTMTALWHTRASGQGQYVDVAMTDSVLALSELAVAHYSYTGVSPRPAGNSMPGLAPFGSLRAKDGVIVIAAAHDPQFRELVCLIGRPELATDPRFDSEPQRWQNREALDEILEAFTRTRTKRELRELFGAHVPFGPVQTAEEMFADPHFAARNMLPRIEQPGSAEPVAVPGVPVKLSVTPGEVRVRAPLVGEHSREILAEIGIDAERVEQLLEAAVVAAR